MRFQQECNLTAGIVILSGATGGEKHILSAENVIVTSDIYFRACLHRKLDGNMAFLSV